MSRPKAAPAHFPYHHHRTLAEVWNHAEAKDEVDGRNADQLIRWGSDQLLVAIRRARG